MIRNITVLLLILSTGFIEYSQATIPPASSVPQSFESLKAALRTGNGKEAASLVTPATLRMYEKCRKLALNSSNTDFETLSQLEVLLIFQLRWLLDKKTLQSMNGKEVFSWGVDEGMVKKQTLESIQLDNVQVEGKKAVSTLFNGGKPVTDLVLYFELNNKIWQLDLARILNASDAALAGLRKKTGKTKTELALFLIEHTYKKEIPPEIVKGPLK